MSRSIRILHLEDEAHDRELVLATLRHEGLSCAVEPVSTRAAFETALQDEQRVLRRTTELAKANRSLAENAWALRQSEGRLNAILDNSPAVIRALAGSHRATAHAGKAGPGA